MDRKLKPCEQLSRGCELIRLTSLILVLSIFLALASCQTTASKVFPEGEYSGPGGFWIILKEGNYWHMTPFYNPPRYQEMGSYSVDGDQITFLVMEYRGDYGCENVPKYILQWAYDPNAQTLTLKNIYDPCDSRGMALIYTYVQEDE